MGKIVDGKLGLARQRKESLQTQKQIGKMQKQIDHFREHTLLRQDALLKNIKLFNMYQQEQRKNMEVSMDFLIF